MSASGAKEELKQKALLPKSASLGPAKLVRYNFHMLRSPCSVRPLDLSHKPGNSVLMTSVAHTDPLGPL